MKYLRKIFLLVFFSGIVAFLIIGASAGHSARLRHVVAFKFKPGVSIEQMQKVSRDFHALEDKVPQIIEFEGGADIKFPEEGRLNEKKYTHCFIVTVKDEKDLAAYGSHPDHKAFSRYVDPLLEEVMVLDYYSN